MGVEPTQTLLCRQPPHRLAPASSVLARNRTWTSTFARLHAHPAHPEDVNLLAARRGVEPRLAVSRTAVRSGTLAGCVNQYPDLDLNQGLDLRRVQCKSATPSGREHEREESNPVVQFWRLAEQFPSHVVCAWLGNSEVVAREHYLQVTDEHFKAATGRANGAMTASPRGANPQPVNKTKAKQNPKQYTAAMASKSRHRQTANPEFAGKNAKSRQRRSPSADGEGFEPPVPLRARQFSRLVP